LREEHKLRVLENRVLRKIFEPKKDEVTGQWRRLHNEELCYHTKYYSGVKTNDSEINRASGMYGGQEMCIRDFGGET
jgi:hypothetical protein